MIVKVCLHSTARFRRAGPLATADTCCVVYVIRASVVRVKCVRVNVAERRL